MHDRAGFRDKATYKLLHHSITNKLLLVYGLYHQIGQIEVYFQNVTAQ